MEQSVEAIYLYDAQSKRVLESNTRRSLQEKRRHIGERRYRRKDGAVIVVDTSASVISYNGKTALCAVSRDVTERKRFEEVQIRLACQAELRADVSAALTESGALRGILQRCAEAL